MGGYADRLHGLVVGADGAILRTEDGGHSWQEQDSGTSAHLFGVAFRDSSAAYAVGDAGTVLATTDGGRSWLAIESGTSSTLYTASFSSENHGAIGGSAGTMLWTENGGLDWALRAAPGANGVLSIGFLDERTAIVAAGGIAATTDGGRAWHQLVYCGNDVLNDVVFSSPALGCAAGTVLRSMDEGMTWARIDCGASADLNGVVLVGESTAFVVGALGVVRRTGDAGMTWEVLDSPMRISFLDIAFATPDSGIVCAEAGITYHTADGGKDWEQSWLETTDAIVALAVVDAQVATAVSSLGGIARTDDGGKSWQWQILPPWPPAGGLMDVAFADRDHGIAVGFARSTMVTNDGGEHWVDAELDMVNVLYGVAASQDGGYTVVGTRLSVLQGPVRPVEVW
ncbi:MAG TPA: YCF48-related protein [Candidatus Krumholzibacteria bacterium]|nr:YCF48-related protein [Candidatus Krumholzibacteria bacterium]